MTPPRPLFRLALPAAGLLLLGLLVLQARTATDGAPVPAAPPAPSRGAIRAEGRVVPYPGAQVVVGTERPGRLARLLVEENSPVVAGQLLAEIDSSEERAALAEARARVAEAEADAKLAEAELARATRLADEEVGSRAEVERRARDLDTARARTATAAAVANRLEAALAKHRIVAPLDGVVLARHVEPGEILPAGTPLVTVADTTRVRIEAEVDEYDAGRIAAGAAVTIRAEGWEGNAWRGTVEQVPHAVDDRRLRPRDPGRPTDVRVLMAKVALAEPTPFKLGQRVDLEISGR